MKILIGILLSFALVALGLCMLIFTNEPVRAIYTTIRDNILDYWRTE